jgi:transcription antitermination factor NusG
MMAGWLVIACKGGWEDKARRELEMQLYPNGDPFVCWMPWAMVPRVKRGKPYEAREPMLPCYVLVWKPEDVTLEQMNIGAINSARGVIGAVSIANGGQPNVVADRGLDLIRNALSEDGLYHVVPTSDLPKLNEGDAVKLKHGSLAGFPAQFVRYEHRRKSDVALIEVSLFGRVVAVIVPPSQLKAAS